MEYHPVVKPERPIMPEFDSAGQNAETGPVRRPGDRPDHMLRGELGHALFQLPTSFQRTGLPGCPGADLTAARPAVVVFIRLRFAHGFDRAFDADLPFQGFPVKAQGGVRVFSKLRSLAAFEIV